MGVQQEIDQVLGAEHRSIAQWCGAPLSENPNDARWLLAQAQRGTCTQLDAAKQGARADGEIGICMGLQQLLSH